MVEVSTLELKNYLPLLTFVQRYLQSSDIDFSLPLIDHLLQAVPGIFGYDFPIAVYNAQSPDGRQVAFLTLVNALPWCETRKVNIIHMALVVEALLDYEANKKVTKR